MRDPHSREGFRHKQDDAFLGFMRLWSIEVPLLAHGLVWGETDKMHASCAAFHLSNVSRGGRCRWKRVAL